MRGVVFFALFAGVWLLALAMTWGLALLPLTAYCCLVFFRHGERAEAAKMRLESMLMDGEEVLHLEIQSRPLALESRRALIAVTDSRIIMVKRAMSRLTSKTGGARAPSPAIDWPTAPAGRSRGS